MTTSEYLIWKKHLNPPPVLRLQSFPCKIVNKFTTGRSFFAWRKKRHRSTPHLYFFIKWINIANPFRDRNDIDRVCPLNRDWVLESVLCVVSRIEEIVICRNANLIRPSDAATAVYGSRKRSLHSNCHIHYPLVNLLISASASYFIIAMSQLIIWRIPVGPS
jgi:hypothetical protein